MCRPCAEKKSHCTRAFHKKSLSAKGLKTFIKNKPGALSEPAEAAPAAEAGERSAPAGPPLGAGVPVGASEKNPGNGSQNGFENGSQAPFPVT